MHAPQPWRECYAGHALPTTSQFTSTDNIEMIYTVVLINLGHHIPPTSIPTINFCMF
jgi:hypothetical protein